jgi:hypothetical protein
LRNSRVFSVEDSKLGACHQSMAECHQCLLSGVQHGLGSGWSAAWPSPPTEWSAALPSQSLQSTGPLACRAALLSTGSNSLCREVSASLRQEAVVEFKTYHYFAVGGRSTVRQQKGVANLLSGRAEFLRQMHRHTASLLDNKRIIHQEERL